MISKYSKILLRSLVTFSCFACAKSNEGETSDPGPKKISVTIDPSKHFQTIDNFAASDAWACQFVGNWPDAKRNAIADLLFSNKFKADGSPEGIALSLWRFNVGAGSAQQGTQSGIGDEWRRAESFLTSAGMYDWNLQAGQMWFLKAAKDRGVNKFLAFPNSPPVQLTLNNKAFATGAKPNLAPDKYEAFASFLTDVVKGVHQKTGIMFDYLSPVNEPQWDWSDGGQEGTPFTNTDISGIVKALDVSIKKNNLPSKITAAEAGQYEFLYSSNGKADKGNQIDAFFNTSSPNYIGNLTSVEKLICGHSYFTTSTYPKAVAIRKELAAKVSSISGLGFWQSEYCILGDNENEMKGEGRDLGINPALYLARVIHNDLVNANASAWQWWLAVSPYNYKDGLIYVDKNKTDGAFFASKMLWSLGNYSRFIPPGSVRVNIAAVSGEPEVLISSYKTPSNQLVTVIINTNSEGSSVDLKLSSGALKNATSYTTSSTKDLECKKSLDLNTSLTVDARSICTIVATLE